MHPGPGLRRGLPAPVAVVPQGGRGEGHVSMSIVVIMLPKIFITCASEGASFFKDQGNTVGRSGNRQSPLRQQLLVDLRRNPPFLKAEGFQSRTPMMAVGISTIGIAGG